MFPQKDQENLRWWPLSRVHILRLLVIPSFAVSFVFVLHNFWSRPYRVEGTEKVTRTEDSLVVQLSTDKEVYKLGEPIKVTITLRNASHDGVFWVSKSRSIVRWPGGFMLDVHDTDGTRLPDRIPVADMSPSPSKEMDLIELILRKRSLFGPGDFLGFTRNLEDCGYTIREPGRYRLRASYGDQGLGDVAEAYQIEAARKHKESWILKIPIWSGEIRSQPVWIQITP